MLATPSKGRNVDLANGVFWTSIAPYNQWMFAFALAGIGVSLIGFAFAIWQIRKVKSSAKSAQNAAQDTASKMGGLTVLVDTSELCRYSSIVVELVRARNYAGAAVRAMDLREKMASIRVTPQGVALLAPRSWQLWISCVAELQESLEGFSMDPQAANTDKVTRCRDSAYKIHEKLVGLASIAAQKTEVHNANT